jgi:hypothetical protein
MAVVLPKSDMKDKVTEQQSSCDIPMNIKKRHFTFKCGEVFDFTLQQGIFHVPTLTNTVTHVEELGADIVADG